MGLSFIQFHGQFLLYHFIGFSLKVTRLANSCLSSKSGMADPENCFVILVQEFGPFGRICISRFLLLETYHVGLENS